MTFKSLAPSILLAAPQLGDPNFERRVVLLGKHEEEGALGWVLNGAALAPVGEMLVAAELVPPGMLLPETLSFQRSARVGGPVHMESGWLLYRRTSATFEGEFPIGDELAICSNQDAVRAIVHGDEPRDFRLILGYAGWGPGQLEAELKEGVWLPGPADTALVFDTQRAALWDAALQEATGATNATFQGKQWGLA